MWLEDGKRFTLVSWGSSSCPRVVTALDATSDDELELRVEPTASAGVCTTEMAATTDELAVPETLTSRPIAIVLTYSDWDGTTELTLD